MAERVRLLVLLPNLAGAGGQRAVLDMCRGLDRRVFEVNLLVQERRGRFLSALHDSDNVEFLLDREFSRTDIPRLLMQTVLRARKADIVIGGLEGRASFGGLIAAKLAKKPFVGWIHIDWEPFLRFVSWRQRLSLRAYRWANRVVACSIGAAESFARLFAVPRKLVEPIYNGLPLATISDRGEEALPGEFVEIYKKPCVVMVGRLDPQKRCDLLIDAHAQLRREGLDVDLVIVGEGGQRGALEQQVDRLGIRDCVHFAGFQSNPYPFIKNAKVLALSSEFEGFGLVLVEAMVCGTPIVSTDCPSGPREVLQDGACGVLVPPGDVGAFATALKNILTDHSAAAGMAERARDRAQLFSIQKSSEEWEKLLLDLVPAGRRREIQEGHLAGRREREDSTFGVNANR